MLDAHKRVDKRIHEHDPFFEPSVKVLNQIISSTNCELVISSGWRRFYDLEQMREIFEWNQVQKVPTGFTQDYDKEDRQLPPGKEIEMLRCREIISWLETYDANGRFSWCAVDDMDLSFGLDKFVRCPDIVYGLIGESQIRRFLS